MSDVIISVHRLSKLFPAGRASLFSRQERHVHAVDDVSFDLARGETLALVGESGCGKSTLALALMGLEQPTGGEIFFEGQNLAQLSAAGRRQMRQRIQMIFQDPYESLNPTQTIGEIVAEPLDVHGLARQPEQRQERILQALEDAGLKPPTEYLHRFPHQLSGGQRQRVVIAAALVLQPVVLLADEPVSMLDVSIRAEIINLLGELRQQRQISVIFITHDLGTIGHFADRTAVMYLGRIVEIGPTAQVLADPQHPYTRALLSVIPVPNPRLRRERIILQGETPNPIDIPPGCRFQPRCPAAMAECLARDPRSIETGPGHQAACLLLEGKSRSERGI